MSKHLKFFTAMAMMGILSIAIASNPKFSKTEAKTSQPLHDPFRDKKVAWEKIDSWAAQTGNMPKTLDAMTASTVDLGMIDIRNRAGELWKRKEVLIAKQNKWLVAYLSVGQISKHDWFWQENWEQGNPKWILHPSKVYLNSFDVNIAAPEWLELMKQSIDRILEQGFDGVGLDVLDVYWHPTYPGGPSKANMASGVQLTCALYRYGKSKLPGFKMIVNNATNLVADFPEYRGCIHATIGESIWYYSTNKPRPQEYTSYQIGQLNINLRYGKKVLIMDKATQPDFIARVYREALKHEYIPFATDGNVGVLFPLRPREK